MAKKILEEIVERREKKDAKRKAKLQTKVR
jgi:hypothetical protein